MASWSPWEAPFDQPDSAKENLAGSPLRVAIVPDKEGKFRIDGLAPGMKFGLTVIKSPYQLEISGKDITDMTLRPGETKDLGDVQAKE